MPKEQWPQWRLIYWADNQIVLQQQPINAGTPAAAIERALGQLLDMAGRRMARRIRAEVDTIEVRRI